MIFYGDSLYDMELLNRNHTIAFVCMLICATVLSCLAAPAIALAEPPLTWKDCVQEAFKNHPDIAAAAAQVSQARARRDIAQSTFLPHISGFANRTRTNADLYPDADTYSYGITASQLLFDAFKTSYDISAAEEAVRSAEFAYMAVSSDVRYRLRIAFVELLRAQKLLSIAQNIADRRRKNLELVRLRYTAGREHKGSLLTAEANLSQAEFEVAQAGRNLTLAQQRLARELGRKAFSAISVQGRLAVTEPTAMPDNIEEMARANFEVQRRIALKEQAKFGLKSARADLAPKLYANASAGRTSSDWPPRNDEWSIGINLTLPLFEGGIRRAELARARAALRQAEAEEQSAINEAVASLRDKWTKFANAVEQAVVQKKFLDAAQARATIARSQYSTGLISFDTWTIIEDDLVRAEKALLSAEADAMILEADWIKARGGTLENAE